MATKTEIRVETCLRAWLMNTIYRCPTGSNTCVQASTRIQPAGDFATNDDVRRTPLVASGHTYLGVSKLASGAESNLFADLPQNKSTRLSLDASQTLAV